jgi:hypothetical protein
VDDRRTGIAVLTTGDRWILGDLGWYPCGSHAEGPYPAPPAPVESWEDGRG